VTGIDPAQASLDVARTKAGADRVTWLEGGAPNLPPLAADLATMTGNVAQAIHDPVTWDATLAAVHRALRPGGTLVFETRDPAFRGWQEWTRERSHRVVDTTEGAVETWVELTDVALPLVSFRWTFVFHSDHEVLISDSTLRFRERDEVEAQLASHGYLLEEIAEAPDRPGRELVFVARRPR
jgi:SAM-dependent methyltransferase